MYHQKVVNCIQQLAYIAGKTHDLGKYGQWFAAMLESVITQQGKPTIRDPYQHSWVSAKLLEQLGSKGTIDVKALNTADNTLCTQPLDNGVSALNIIVATHHFLLGPTKAIAFDDQAHRRSHEPITPFSLVDDIDWQPYQQLLDEAHRLTLSDKGRWFYPMVLARAAMILADHRVSAQHMAMTGTSAYANTMQQAGEIRYNQTLDFHLQAVADATKHTTAALFNEALPSLPDSSMQRLKERLPGESPYAWQNTLQAVGAHEGPLLILNTAPTGAGKTIANVKLLAALRPNGLRVSYCLGLRSLTLQSGYALGKYLGLNQETLAVVIGDKPTLQVFAHNHPAWHEKKEEEQPQVFFDTVSQAKLPSELAFSFPEAQHGFLAAPFLVSTVDYLIAASQPGRQGHHVVALARLMHSDLILDEIDQYNVSAFPALLLLVKTAAALGRHVVCSSATLPPYQANALKDAWQAGLAHYTALKQSVTASVAVVHSAFPPQLLPTEQLPQAYCQLMTEHAQANHVTKCAQVLPLAKGTDAEHYFETIYTGFDALHCHHHEYIQGKRVSFGLVRVARVKTAALLTHYLARHCDTKTTHIVCYTAQDTLAARAYKESVLDRVLNRQHGKQLDHPEVLKRIECSPGSDVMFIVVASPVEEVGRDHDFDWAIIEPTSLHSIIQTAGRVNRHRLYEVCHPNIFIMDIGFHGYTAPDAKTYYAYPGLETERNRYTDPRMSVLLEVGYTPFELDARLRFGSTQGMTTMAKNEQKMLQSQLDKPVKLITQPKYERHLLTRGFYQQYPLREPTESQTLAVQLKPSVLSNIPIFDAPVKVQLETLPIDLWLASSWEAQQHYCQKMGLTEAQGMTAVLHSQKDKTLHYCIGIGFYYV
ncbi:hypothetical protein KCM76_22365 [Zooshikella marina]|uniref:hypothetical protein n=1 Tax=Zooshikella ganghwensis TaxID=202772 RepID=UPI001BAFFF93|nr:hypothetical protein [Zooshikella ganghwensis]MBU2708754.1 hypothetical protein [Zooshikella ganghwensis]